MTVPCRPAALLVSFALVFAGCSGGGGGETPTSPLAPSAAQVEFDSYTLVNGARSQNNVDPQLELRESIAQVAREHSRAMRDDGFFGHRDTLGKRVGERLTESGVSFRVVAENLAMVTNSPNPAAWAHDRLMASSEHRPNILDSRVELIGVGVVTDGPRYWITQIFVGR